MSVFNEIISRISRNVCLSQMLFLLLKLSQEHVLLLSVFSIDIAETRKSKMAILHYI